MRYTISESEYITSSPDLEHCPKTLLPEYSFLGRSNVGKSSLINRLVGKKNLARSSNTPGKTQTINYYLCDNSFYLVDFPGYGYAKTSKSQREFWKRTMEKYLLFRENLIQVFLLVDARIPVQEIDLYWINWLGENDIPFAICLSKTDKISRQKQTEFKHSLIHNLTPTWQQLPPILTTSGNSKNGGDEILSFIGGTKHL